MFCTQCGSPTDPRSAVCARCSAPLRQPEPDRALRETALTLLLDASSSPRLSDWLRDLDADAKGTIEQKKQRIRQHTTLLTCPTRDFIDMAVRELRGVEVQWSVDLCEKLGLSIQGTKSALIRRIHRHISMCEGQLARPAQDGRPPGLRDVYPVVAWYPVYQSRPTERDYYEEFFDTMVELFGERHVHRQVAVAHASVLQIDFHIGALTANGEGVGVEFKRPTSNSDVMKAQGQLLQYQTRYRDSLILVIFPNDLDSKHLFAFREWLKERAIAHVVKKVWDEE